MLWYSSHVGFNKLCYFWSLGGILTRYPPMELVLGVDDKLITIPNLQVGPVAPPRPHHFRTRPCFAAFR